MRPLFTASLRAAVLLALAVATTACPTEPPTAVSPYLADRLAPGNRIFLVGTPFGTNTIVSNPGGTADFPSDPAPHLDLYRDTTGTGNPVNGDYVGDTTLFAVGMYDASGTLRKDFGVDTSARLFSADGSTFVLTRTDVSGTFLDVYDTSTMTVRRSFTWPAGAGIPYVEDLSRDGSRILIRADATVQSALDRPVYTATTTGTDPLVAVVPATTERKATFRLTTEGRVVYSVDIGHTTQSQYELRSVAIDGTGGRVLTTYQTPLTMPFTSAEIGTNRVLVLMGVPGSMTAVTVVAIEDSLAATRTTIVSPIPGNVVLSRLVAPA